MPRFDDFLDDEEDEDMEDPYEDEEDEIFGGEGFDDDSKVSEFFDSIVEDLSDEELEKLHGMLSDYLGK